MKVRLFWIAVIAYILLMVSYPFIMHGIKSTKCSDAGGALVSTALGNGSLCISSEYLIDIK